MIQPIVEGHGELTAVPELLRRLMTELGIFDIGVRRPIRQTRGELLSEERFRRAIRLACLQPGVRAILVIFDLDDDCARDIVPRLRKWGEQEAPRLPLIVSLARREYEAWFLAAVESHRGKRRIRNDAGYPGNPEAIRDAKGAVSRFMPPNLPYAETADQVALTAQLHLGQAYRRASSFRKLVKELSQALAELGCTATIPREWLD